MAGRYQTGDRVYVQAQRIWLILSSHAVLRREIRCNGFRKGLVGYGDLAELMGKDRRGGNYSHSATRDRGALLPGA